MKAVTFPLRHLPRTRGLLGAAVLVTAALVGASGCAAEDDGTEGGEAAATGVAGDIAIEYTNPALAITEPAALAELERSGFGFGHHFGSPDLGADGTPTNASVLAQQSAYGSFVNVITQNVDAVAKADPQAKVGMEYLHRLFDTRWLRHSLVRFSLVGVTNRMDRALGDDCGEIRFIYRLEYQDPGESRTNLKPEMTDSFNYSGLEQQPTAAEKWSRMPMTVVAVIPQPKVAGSCREPAKKWLAIAGERGVNLAKAAAGGPLKGIGELRTLETNLQSVRWPAGGWNELGGHAEYMLNVYRFTGTGAAKSVALVPLENTPDVDKLVARDSDSAEVKKTKNELKSRFVAWLNANAALVDNGTAKVPDEFLATTSFAIGPHGFARMGNRPFARILGADGAGLGDWPGALTGKVAKSRTAAVRRLDELSCPGCHQSRSTAGFHLLGEEDPANRKIDYLVVGPSAHMLEELGWRQNLLTAAADGRSLDVPRPFAEHAKDGPGGMGAHCQVADGGDPSFASWTCAAGLDCIDPVVGDAVGDARIGECGRTTGRKGGDRCQVLRIRPRDDSRERTFTESGATVAVGSVDRELSCGDKASCSLTSGGFPGGACTSTCSTPGLTADKDVICGIAPPKDFDGCLHGRSFEDCMVPDKQPITRNGQTFEMSILTLSTRTACDHSRPCRDDYACTRAVLGLKGIGQCMPPYFLFQARVDGHNPPLTRGAPTGS